MTTIALRKNLFQVLDSVAKGMPAEIEYKGANLSISPVAKGSVFDNLIERDLDWDLKDNESGWSKESPAEWNAEWDEFLATEAKMLKGRKKVRR